MPKKSSAPIQGPVLPTLDLGLYHLTLCTLWHCTISDTCSRRDKHTLYYVHDVDLNSDAENMNFRYSRSFFQGILMVAMATLDLVYTKFSFVIVLFYKKKILWLALVLFSTMSECKLWYNHLSQYLYVHNFTL